MASSSERFNTVCNTARPVFAKYCSEPCPRDWFVRQRWTMSGAHLVILESLQNIYGLADSINPADEQTFALYCFFAIQNIEHHHHLEETIIFPMMAPEFTTNVLEEHATFSRPINELDTYLKSILGVEQGKKYGQTIPVAGKAREKFSAAKIKSLLEDIVDPLFTHLQHEVGWLDPDKIRASGLTSQRLSTIEERTDEHLQARMSNSLAVFFLGNAPPYCQFPVVPWIARKVIVPWVFWWKDRAAWRFLPRTFVQP